MPQEVNTIVKNLLKYTKLLDRDSQINLPTMHVHRSDIGKASTHRCSRSCWRHFPLWTDGHICGVSSIMILCIAAKDELSFKFLEGGQDQTDGYDYLKNISQFNDYLRFVLITWMTQGRIYLTVRHLPVNCSRWSSKSEYNTKPKSVMHLLRKSISPVSTALYSITSSVFSFLEL